MRQTRALLFAAAGFLIALANPAAAQSDYPNRPIRVIIPFPAGGSNDIVGRMIGTSLSDKLGKQVVVDNRAGAGGVVGTEIASKAPADGYTLLVISLAHAVNPWLYKLPYDPLKSTPIGIMGTGTNVLTVHPSLPVNSLKEFLAMAKEKPGELSYASAGIGSLRRAASPRANRAAMPCASDHKCSATISGGGLRPGGSRRHTASAAVLRIANARSPACCRSGWASGGTPDSNMAE